MEKDIIIRKASVKDAEELLRIYTPYVKDTAISFEYEVPDVEEFKNRISNILKRYPYLVAEQDSAIVGYAYAGAFKTRAAYDWAVETTIYVKQDERQKGIGKKLYAALETTLKKQGILSMNACIAYPDIEDEYLTKDSPEFHKKLGFEMVGMFHKCGYKFGRWYDMVWMEKMLGEHPEEPEPVKNVSEIRGLLNRKYDIG